MSSSLIPRPVIPVHETGTAIVVFLVKLSDDEERFVKSELEFPGPDRFPFASAEYVLWTGLSEGTRVDIFELTVEASKKGHGNVIFVDSMSLSKKFKKKTVVLSRANDRHCKVEVGRLKARVALLSAAGPLMIPDRFPHGDIMETTFEIVVNPSAPPFCTNVVKADHTELETDLATLNSLPQKLELDPKRPMVVFTSILSNADEQAVKTELERADTEVHNFIYHSWIGSKPASRADLFRLIRETRMAHSRPYYWNMLFVDAQSLATNTLIAARFDYDADTQIEETVYFKRIPYMNAPRLWRAVLDCDRLIDISYGPTLNFDEYMRESAASETIKNPQGPFYFQLPPYLQEEDGEFVPSVFFLTKLSEQDERP